MTTAQHITHLRTLNPTQTTDYLMSLDRDILESVVTALDIVSLISRSELVEYATDALSYS